MSSPYGGKENVGNITQGHSKGSETKKQEERRHTFLIHFTIDVIKHLGGTI